jgi:hypothetical protein
MTAHGSLDPISKKSSSEFAILGVFCRHEVIGNGRCLVVVKRRQMPCSYLHCTAALAWIAAACIQGTVQFNSIQSLKSNKVKLQ